MADEPIAELNGLTPMQAANTPTFDRLAPLCRMGTLKTVADGFHPGSEVANMSILGYDLNKCFEGRGVLEAASIGVPVYDGEIAMRCNLICIENGIIKNHSAGHITSEESKILIDCLEEKLGDDIISFHHGVSYRNLLKIKNGKKNLNCTPPHDIPLCPFRDYLVKPLDEESIETANLINNLIIKSQEILSAHPLNLKRVAEGKDPANSIWPWSPGYRPNMQKLTERFNLTKGAVISAVDLIRGIGIYAGLECIMVDGATGLYNTNYLGKAHAAIEALKSTDFVFLHIEASDEAGHEGDVDLKIKTIENLDHLICKPILESLDKIGDKLKFAILPDHPTPCKIRTHTNRPVPFMIYDPNSLGDGIPNFDEQSALHGSFGQLERDEFIKELLK